MSDFIDYYDIMGVSRNATAEDLRQAYRRLALELHPDRNPTEEAHRRFLLLGQAYQTLIDPVKRGHYNLRYDKIKGLSKAGGNAAQSYEMVRRKRMSRYNRTGYAQRVRYRGTSSGGGQPHHPGMRERSTSSQRERTQRAYTEAHVERILAEERSAELGFRYYARLMRALAGGILLFCLTMIIDRALATRTAEEKVLSKEDMMWSFTAPGVTRIKTHLSTFAIKDYYAKSVDTGTRVAVVKSPLAKVPVQAYVYDQGWQGPLPVYASRYTGVFLAVWGLVLSSLATLGFRGNPEFNAYLGSFNIFLALVIFGLILT